MDTSETYNKQTEQTDSPSDEVGNKVVTIWDWPTSFLYRKDWKQYSTAHRRGKGCFSFTIDISRTTMAGLYIEREEKVHFKHKVQEYNYVLYAWK